MRWYSCYGTGMEKALPTRSFLPSSWQPVGGRLKMTALPSSSFVTSGKSPTLLGFLKFPHIEEHVFQTLVSISMPWRVCKTQLSGPHPPHFLFGRSGVGLENLHFQ